MFQLIMKSGNPRPEPEMVKKRCLKPVMLPNAGNARQGSQQWSRTKETSSRRCFDCAFMLETYRRVLYHSCIDNHVFLLLLAVLDN